MIAMGEIVRAIDGATRGRRVLVASGVGTHQSIAAREFSWDYPDRTFLTSAGLGTMGSGLPMLVGAWLEAPDHMPILITGDGSFLMECPGLATVRELEMPLKAFVLDNRAFGIVQQYESLNGIRNVATIRPGALWPDIAWGFGMVGWHMDDFHGDLEVAVGVTLEEEDAALLHIPVDTVGVWPLLEAGKLEMTHEP